MSINSHCRILSRNISRLSISKFLAEGRRKKEKDEYILATI
ncbi:hypothetical protein [Okeania sp. SIO3B5]|nr:hypothetical protein [Okeania sp. SIO3B5]